ncbi:MAG: YcbK family protein [Granulosicoccus sp.]
MKIDDNEYFRNKIDSTDVEGRRRFLRATSAALFGAPAAASMLAAMPALAKSDTRHAGRVPLIDGSEASALQGALAELEPMANRRLHLVNEHTGDDVDVIFYAYGIYRNESISRLNHLMRDRRANTATQMDTTLYNQLFMLCSVLGNDEPIHVLSGYRTPETNAKLRRRSKRVAKYSLHMEGRAADIYIPGYSAKKIQKAALELQAGGVGLYSKSNFVHIDTGQVRHWGG